MIGPSEVDWRRDQADIIDMLTMWPEARRRIVRILGKLEAEA
jgi:hypothetical protein